MARGSDKGPGGLARTGGLSRALGSPRRHRGLALALTAMCALVVLAGCLSRSLTGLVITPAAGATTVAAGQSSQFQAQAVYTESGHATTSKDATAQVSWASSNPAVATISSAGLATGVGAGTATITGSMSGSFGTVTATSDITVTGGTGTGSGTRTLTSLTLTPTSLTIPSVGQTAQFVAIGTYNTGSPVTQVLTNQVAWQSSDARIAQVSTTGLVTAEGPGQTTIIAVATAADGSAVTASGAVTVSAGGALRVLNSVAVIPALQTVLATNETSQFLAIGTYTGGSPVTVDLTDQVTWISSDVKIAQVDASGLVTALGAGQVTITALATAADGSVVSGSSVLTDDAGAGPVNLPTLTVYKAGSGSGVVTGNGIINCGTGAACTGTFPKGAVVTLTATPQAGSQFDGWSANCIPVTGTPTSCTLTLNNNDTVGAIFDPVTP